MARASFADRGPSVLRNRSVLGGSVATALVIAFLLILPTGTASTAEFLGQSSAIVTDSSPATNTTLVYSGTHYDLSPYLWGTTVSARSELLPDEQQIVNATPTQMIVWPGGAVGDEYDYKNNRTYNENGSAATWAVTNESQFVSWCKPIHCQSIFEVPGEINNTAFAAQEVRYTEVNLSFHPTYWEIGNEPEIWTQWNVSWQNWTSKSTTTGPTPTEYAKEVARYIAAMRAVDPEIRILGIAATGHDDGPWTVNTWVADTIAANCGNLSGVAIHDYPAGVERNENKDGDILAEPTLNQFYSAMNNEYGLVKRTNSVRGTIQNTVTNSCHDSGLASSIPVLVTEVGSALSHFQYADFSSNFPGGLDLGAQMIQAMDLNLTNVDLFASVMGTSNSWFDFHGNERPDYEMYAGILSHLGSVAYPASFNNSNFNGSVYAVATAAPSDHGREDLLVINANTTVTFGPKGNPENVSGDSITFVPDLPKYVAGDPIELWQWNGTWHPGLNGVSGNATWVSPATLAPVPTYFPHGFPATFTLPSQAVALFEWYPGGATPLTLNSSGLPPTERWFEELNGRLFSTDAPTITSFVPQGTYAVSAPPVYIRVLTRIDKSYVFSYIRNPNQRYEPFPPSPIIVGASPVYDQLPFALQWKTQFEVEGLGQIVPDVGWANNSTSFHVTAAPDVGNVFVRWTGFENGTGRGAVNSTKPSITVDPTGAIVEIAHFGPSTNVTFAEMGLPDGTNWSVTVQDLTRYSTGANVSIPLLTGRTVSFAIGGVPGYWSIPRNSSVTPKGDDQAVSIVFHKHTPPLPKFPLIFEEQGLPNGTVWSVTAVNVTVDSTSRAIYFNETVDRKIGFSVANVSGYRSVPRNSSVVEEANETIVNVTFIQRHPPGVQAPLVFVEEGLPGGTNWTVTAANVTHNSTNASITFVEVVGRNVGFSVWLIPGYRSVPRNNSTVEQLNLTIVQVNFTALTPPGPQYTVNFDEQGLPQGVLWNITVRSHITSRNVTLNSTGSPIAFEEIAGTYGYLARTVPGYAASPRSAGFVVAPDDPVTVSIEFHLVVYPVIFQEVGLNSGINWTVNVSSAANPTTTHGAWATANLSNGTYHYQIPRTADYNPTPNHGIITVTGSSAKVSVTFERAMFEVRFVTQGYPGSQNWNVRLGDIWTNSSTGNASFAEPNGSYSFDVQAPAGYYPSPSHGNLTVSGPSPGQSAGTPWMVVAIDFKPSAPPPPPTWALGGKAIIVTLVVGASGLIGFAIIRRIVRRGATPTDDAY